MSYRHVQTFFNHSMRRSALSINKKTVVIHIRGGSSRFDISPGETSPRGLTNAYYFSVLNQIKANYCEVNETLELIILTDIPQASFIYRPISSQLKYWKNEKRFHDGGIEILGETFDEFNIDFLSKFTVIRGGDPISAIQLMKEADFLVISQSSFSYVGAILNTRGKVFYPPNFSSQPLNDWIKVK